MIKLFLAGLTLLTLAFPAYAKIDKEQFPVDSPTKPETPLERRERQEREKYTKADSVKIRKAQIDWERRQREYEREEEKLKNKSETDKERKKREGKELEDILNSSNQIKVQLLRQSK